MSLSALAQIQHAMGDETITTETPDNNGTVTSTDKETVEDISQEVDADGEPLSDEEQKEVRKDPWAVDKLNTEQLLLLGNLLKSMAVSGKKMSVEEYSDVWKESSGEMPYCPVYPETKEGEDAGRIFTAYIQGAMNDVDDYIDLIDTLLIADEKDTYFIYIDSPGGLIASGGIIASAIHHSRAEVFTIARGICASAAALVHSAAKPGHAKVTDLALMMYHMSSHWDGGVSTKIRERADNQVRYVNECLLNKALEDGHITEEEFSKTQNGFDVFVTASEFLKRTNTATEETNEGATNE